jgi:ribose transport system substrate-binding protein
MNRNSMRVVLLGLIGCLLAMAAGCSKQKDQATTDAGSGSGAAAKRYLVIFSQCNNAEPYRAAQNQLMTDLFAANKDVDLQITDAQQDNAKQISQIETAIRQKPDLLIVAPNERAPLSDIMKQAMDASIPTICLERDILQPNYTTFIKCDNHAIGKMAGEFIVKKLIAKNGAPKGNIVEISGLKGVEGEQNRQAGADEVFAQYPDIKVIADPVANWLQSNARDRMTEVLAVSPQIDCVYGHNDPMAVGAYLAAKDRGRDKEMFFVGVDGLNGEAGGIKKVVDGVLAATFVYPLCVDKAVEIGNRIMREPGFTPEKEYVMDSAPVTPDNAASLYKP